MTAATKRGDRSRRPTPVSVSASRP